MQPRESWSAAWLSESAPSLAICLKVFGRLSPHFLDLVITPLIVGGDWGGGGGGRRRRRMEEFYAAFAAFSLLFCVARL
jgi:hypothetical protein